MLGRMSKMSPEHKRQLGSRFDHLASACDTIKRHALEAAALLNAPDVDADVIRDYADKIAEELHRIESFGVE